MSFPLQNKNKPPSLRPSKFHCLPFIALRTPPSLFLSQSNPSPFLLTGLDKTWSTMRFSSRRSSVALPPCSRPMVSMTPDHPYFFQLKCENCGNISKKQSCLIQSEQVALPNGKRTVNLIHKCKLGDQGGTIVNVTGQVKGKKLTEFHRQINKICAPAPFSI